MWIEGTDELDGLFELFCPDLQPPYDTLITVVEKIVEMTVKDFRGEKRRPGRITAGFNLELNEKPLPNIGHRDARRVEKANFAKYGPYRLLVDVDAVAVKSVDDDGDVFMKITVLVEVSENLGSNQDLFPSDTVLKGEFFQQLFLAGIVLHRLNKMLPGPIVDRELHHAFGLVTLLLAAVVTGVVETINGIEHIVPVGIGVSGISRIDRLVLLFDQLQHGIFLKLVVETLFEMKQRQLE